MATGNDEQEALSAIEDFFIKDKIINNDKEMENNECNYNA